MHFFSGILHVIWFSKLGVTETGILTVDSSARPACVDGGVEGALEGDEVPFVLLVCFVEEAARVAVEIDCVDVAVLSTSESSGVGRG